MPTEPQNLTGPRSSTGRARAWSRKVHRRRIYSAVAAAALTPIVLLTSGGPASADSLTCFHTDYRPAVMTGGTWAQTTQAAGNTWDDWIWRGPIYWCSDKVPACTYAWGETKSTTVAWSFGALAGGQNNPATALLQLIPNYTRTTTTTTSFTWSITMLPGQYAQPIQVVRRRWEQGVFVGAWVRAPRYDYNCKPTPRSSAKYAYQWQGGYRFGSWANNRRESEFATYHIWR